MGEDLKVSREEVYNLIFNRELSWKEIILDLINTEQLDPWDVDISLLADKFFEKVEEYQKMDFFISSKVILAASLLLRLKSELILSRYVRGIDDILFGEEERKENKSNYERIELDEDIPDLVLRTPIPRYKRVTLNELIESLNKAIITENRRIKKVIINTNALRETGITLPTNKEGINERIKVLEDKLSLRFKERNEEFISYDNFIGLEKTERILSLFPLLQLDMVGKLWLDQKEIFEEINIWIKEVFFKNNPDYFNDLNFEKSELSIEELKRLEEFEDLGEELI